MNMDCVVRAGSRPWLPNSTATNLDVWHENDVPAVGLFETGGEKVLFTAVGGVDSSLTVWAYLPLTAAEFFELDDACFDSVADLMREVEGRFSGRKFILSLAREYTIDFWTVLTSPADSVYAASTDFLKDTVAALKAEVRAATKASEPLPDVRVERLLSSEYVRTQQRTGRREDVQDFLVNRSAIELVLS